MKNVKIKIHQLGMIGESEEIALNRLMIFSGESGLGKSYLSIICHYIFAVLLDNKRINSFFEKNGFDFNNPAVRDELFNVISIKKYVF